MKPDFLCIGAQKAGTTWLYQALRQHPQVSMPPIKENHYFDRGKRPYALDLLSKHAPTRRRFLRWLRDGLRSGWAGWQESLWCVRFLSAPFRPLVCSPFPSLQRPDCRGYYPWVCPHG
ncbi:MAG: sulfotransferase [Chloroflexi bacterium]|nr:sulfotransferase [Chloroflexota bacterium]